VKNRDILVLFGPRNKKWRKIWDVSIISGPILAGKKIWEVLVLFEDFHLATLGWISQIE